MIGVPIARIRGIEIRVQVGWILVVAIVAALTIVQLDGSVPGLPPIATWVLGALAGIGFFGSTLVHDLAHALTARRRGVDVSSLVVSFFGGTTPLDPASREPGADLAIAASGPIASVVLGLALGGVAIGIATGQGDVVAAISQVFAVLGVLNLMLGLVNLAPAYPLDGGRIVRAAVWRRNGSEAGGWRAAAATGRLTGLLVVAAGLGIALNDQLTNGAMAALSGWFLILSSRAIRERIKVDALIGGLTVADVMEAGPTTVGPGLTVDTIAGQLLDTESPTTAVPVVEDSVVQGIIGVREIRRLRSGQWGATRVAAVMARPPRMAVVRPADALAAAVERLQRSGLDGLPVLDGTDLVGVLTRRAVGLAVRARSGKDQAPDPNAGRGGGRRAGG